MAQDPGFVFDEASGLYFHASSGFYHDSNAGWYYNTNDGVYYKFEEGTYVPIAAVINSGSSVSDSEPKQIDVKIESTDLDENGLCVLNSPQSGLSKLTGDVSYEPVPVWTSGPVCESAEGDTANGSDPVVDISSLEVGFPLWHYDTLRSIYWYYDKDSRAYYKYYDKSHDELNGTAVEEESKADVELFQQGHISLKDMAVLGNSEFNGGEVEILRHQEKGQHGENEENFKPSSGWVEEALIDLYLRGYPSGAVEQDNESWITSADIFSDGLPRHPSHLDHGHQGSFYNGNSSLINDHSSYSGLSCEMSVAQASIDESDNEGSEELEEGEWIPDEPLRIVDGSLFPEDWQANTYLEKRMHRSTPECPYLMEANGDNGEYIDGVEGDEVEDGEIVPDNGDEIHDFRGEFLTKDREDGNLDNNQRLEEDQWQAQFGQVVREKAREYVIPGAIDLWDWAIVEMETKTPKPRKLSKKLVGRIASSVTKLVSASSGLIRTSAIRATELDFVKVSSGKIYRLRRPSLKHLNTLGTYDSSNPTKDWDFPVLGLSLLGSSEDASLDNEAGVLVQTERQTHALVSKPFVPNTGHWQFQRLVSTNTKKASAVPAALLASKYLSPEEILMNEQRKQKYRDRAAERRTLHGGFGTGPGQKGLAPHDQEKVDAENAIGMEGALKQASLAPPLGSDNVGKRMLKGMGWKEGQTLGVEGGLVRPLQAHGNDGRTGLGWR